MLNNSIRERLEKLAILFIGLLIVLFISGMFFIGTKLEFDRNSARFRETKHFLAIPYHTSTRDTWLTQFNSGNQPAWEPIATSGSRRSVWHGVAGRLNVEFRSLGYLDEMNRFTESSRTVLAQTLTDILSQPGDIYDNLIEATVWFDCVLYELPIPNNSNEPIPEAAVLELLEQCKAKLQD